MLNPQFKSEHERRIAELQEKHNPERIRRQAENLALVKKWEAIQAILKQYPLQSYQPFPPELVVRVVCAFFDCDVESLRKGDMHHKYSRARSVIAAILRRGRMSYPEIGRAMVTNHNTARNACVRVKAEDVERVLHVLRFAVDTKERQAA